MIQSKALVFGVGSVGAVYLYQLQRAGCQVTAICRSNYNAVCQHGFTLNSLRFGVQTYKPDFVFRRTEDCPGDAVYDYVVVCAKALPRSRPSLADMIKPIIRGRKKTAVVLAQNGIAIEEEIAQAFPENPVISGVVYCPSTQIKEGVIEYSEMLNLFELGTYPASAPESHKKTAEKFAGLMTSGGGGAKVFDDVQTARWQKLLMNAAWNPICALTLCTDGGFLQTSQPFAQELVWEIMMEIVRLANKIGVPGIDEHAAAEKLAIAKRRAESGTGREMSMLQDVRQGRRFEVEAILGNTIRLGRKWNVPMPRLETVYALSRARYCAMFGTKDEHQM